MVHRDDQGGTLALKGSRSAAMTEAREQMAANCRGPYRIVAEDNVAAGSATVGSATNLGGGVVVGSSTTKQKTEYQITYRCGT